MACLCSRCFLGSKMRLLKKDCASFFKILIGMVPTQIESHTSRLNRAQVRTSSTRSQASNHRLGRFCFATSWPSTVPSYSSRWHAISNNRTPAEIEVLTRGAQVTIADLPSKCLSASDIKAQSTIATYVHTGMLIKF